ncbi:DUF262 domain-containing protein [Burkholderia stabilis]|uniref:DUF262 domain-containing protein n=1 Tax=Burkholderia stabilis TaxID=95485 RepID=UPI0009F61D9C|nr:DUF262 domain-containing protein [Burkholderia stabilis]HDR9490626.1 DUF262 domain-containing protein [Burkholderia stabilis]HDR9522578.1 DUF262 domain-containing protein [Burkholderia stabilis]HDR9533100.1 DUF262 domain-containing protein [Burkholderia stabilis]HDR9537731.1 DUF262 domain-containing protein [Burkholderia stabilis]HDR9544576.1 DUF262 domain-containing protein [Burkholderia stabilis]
MTSNKSQTSPQQQTLQDVNDEFDYIDVVQEVENEEDSTLSAPDLLQGVGVTDSDWTAETIISQLRKGNIILNPRFQRRDAWDDIRKSRFIESLFLGLPVPQLVLAEIPGSKGRYLVIDGKQRLLALLRFAGIGGEYLRLKDLTIRADLNGKTWSDISDDSLSNDSASFENSQIRTTFIRGWSDERVLYLIFHRLNSGSVPLSPQELRHVLHPGKFIDFAFEFSEHSHVLISILGRKGKPDFRMRDVEMLIRFFGFNLFVLDYAGDLKEFLDETVRRLNSDWSSRSSEIQDRAKECENAIVATTNIFGDDSFSKWTRRGFERRFNRAVFDIMVYYFSDASVRAAVEGREDDVRAAFITLSKDDSTFLRSLETTTKSRESTFYRLARWGRALQDLLGMSIPGLDAVESRM